MRTKVSQTIFLVDDDDDDRTVFAEALFQVNSLVRLSLFESGEKLNEVLCETLTPMPDVIFLNINMPFKNGFECLKEIRSRKDKIKDVIIIMYSTSRNPDTIDKAIDLKADFYAIKPTSISELRSLIRKVLDLDISRPAEKFVLNDS